MAHKTKKNKAKTQYNTTQHNTICAGHHYAQTNTNNVNKICALLQTTGGKDEPNITTHNSERKDAQLDNKK